MIDKRHEARFKSQLAEITLWALRERGRGLRAPGKQTKEKKYTPCGTQTRNPQIRSLMRYSIAPTGPLP